MRSSAGDERSDVASSVTVVLYVTTVVSGYYRIHVLCCLCDVESSWIHLISIPTALKNSMFLSTAIYSHDSACRQWRRCPYTGRLAEIVV